MFTVPRVMTRHDELGYNKKIIMYSFLYVFQSEFI